MGGYRAKKKSVLERSCQNKEREKRAQKKWKGCGTDHVLPKRPVEASSLFFFVHVFVLLRPACLLLFSIWTLETSESRRRRRNEMKFERGSKRRRECQELCYSRPDGPFLTDRSPPVSVCVSIYTHIFIEPSDRSLKLVTRLGAIYINNTRKRWGRRVQPKEGESTRFVILRRLLNIHTDTHTHTHGFDRDKIPVRKY